MSKEISFDTIENFTSNLSKHPAYGVGCQRCPNQRDFQGQPKHPKQG